MKIFIIIFLLFTSTSLFSQPVPDVYVVGKDQEIINEVIKWPTHRIGAQASSFSGFGLNYQYNSNNVFNLKFAAFGFGQIDNSYNDELFGTLGFEFQYNVLLVRYTRFFIMLGTSIWYDESSSTYYPIDYTNGVKSTNITRTYVIGPGFGMEIILGKHLSISGEIGMQYRGGLRTLSQYDYNYQYSTKYPKYIGVGGGCSIAFAF